MIPIKMYGADWCPDCRRAKAFLKENKIDFEFIDVELDKEATAHVEQINNGKRIIPTILIDEEPYTNPDNMELSVLLGVNKKGRVLLFGADWCPDCRRAKSFLRDNAVNYQFIDIDKYDWATARVEEVNKGKRIIPTILIGDVPHANPDNNQLRDLLDTGVEKAEKTYDVIIIGGGAAGLTTSIYAQRDRFDTLILEKKNIGGNTFLTQKIENYPGFTDISGPDLMDRMESQARTYGADIKTGEEVQSIEHREGMFNVKASSGEFKSRAVVLSTGSTYRLLGIPGEQELIGSGVHFCATCDGAFYRDRDLIVIGGGNSAVEESIFLAGFVNSVKIINRGEVFSASLTAQEKLAEIKKIKVYHESDSNRFLSDEKGGFKGVEITNRKSGKTEVLEADGAFIFIGLIPNTDVFKGLIDMDSRGFIKTTGLAQTSTKGIFAAGDCREGAIAQVAAATGEGVLASYGVKDFFK